MYKLILTSNARRDLRRTQVIRKLQRLRENCDEYAHKALKGEYKGKFKLPSGDYRAIYTYDKQTETVKVSRIGHRSSVYK